MSFILDALRKSERERQTGQTPGLPHVVTESHKPSSRGWFAAIAMLLTINLAVLSYWFLFRQERPSPSPEPISATAPRQATTFASATDQPPSTVIVHSVTPAQVSVQTPLPNTMMAPPAPAPAPQAAPVAPMTAAPVATPSPPSAPASPLAARPAVAPPSRLPAAGPMANGSAPERPYSAPRPRLESVPPVSFVDEDRADMEPAGLPERRVQAPATGSTSVTVRPWPGVRPGTPDLRDLPLDFQERIPPLKISMFAYSREPSERFVIIDMKKYRTGDRLPGNLLLLEIQAENLLLELDGQKFRVPRF